MMRSAVRHARRVHRRVPVPTRCFSAGATEKLIIFDTTLRDGEQRSAHCSNNLPAAPGELSVRNDGAA